MVIMMTVIVMIGHLCKSCMFREPLLLEFHGNLLLSAPIYERYLRTKREQQYESPEDLSHPVGGFIILHCQQMCTQGSGRRPPIQKEEESFLLLFLDCFSRSWLSFTILSISGHT